MAEIASAYVSLMPSLRGFRGQLNRQMGPDLDKVGSSGGKRLGDGMTKSFKGSTAGMFKGIAAGLATLGAASFFKDAIQGASDLNEAGTKVEAIFGKVGTAYVNAFSKKGAKALGQTQLEVLNSASTFGTFGKAAGLSGKDLATFSTRLAGLSTDFSSFFNASPQTAIEAIGAALRGEAEPIRQFGILLDDASLKAEAMRLGLLKPTKDAAKIMAAQAQLIVAQKKYNDVVKKSGKDSLPAIKAQAALGQAQSSLSKATGGTVGTLTQQQKILAANSLIFKQSADAQGDFKKTSSGLANQQRILSAQFKDLRSKIGQQLLPVAVRFATFLNDKMIPGLIGMGKAFGAGDKAKPKTFLQEVAVKARELSDKVKAAIPFVKAFFGGLLKGDTGYAGPLEKFAVAGDKVRTAIGYAYEKVKQFGGWLKNDLFPALQTAATDIMPSLQTAFAILTGSDTSGIGGASFSFKSLGDVITQKVIPFMSELIKIWLPAVALNIRKVIDTVIATYKAFISFRDTVAAVASFILKRFADLAGGIGAVLSALGTIPGFEWAQKAGDKMKVAAGEAADLARYLDNIQSKNVTVGVDFKVNGAGQVLLGKGVKVDMGQFKARAGGGPVNAGEPYIVGEKRPELFVPNRSGKIIPKVPDGSAGGAGVVQNFNGNIVAHDYGDFERQMTVKRRRASAAAI